MPDRINHLAVWVAAIAYYLLGYLWYTIFASPWQAMSGKTMSANPGILAGSFVLGLILAYGTGIALTRRPEDQTVAQGISFALFMGSLTYATQTLNNALYEGRPIGLWLIDTGYVLIGFAIIGAIVGGWKKKVAAA